MTGKHTIPTSKFALVSLILLNFMFTIPRKAQNPAKIQNLPKIDKNSSFFVVFARKINVFCYFCAVFVHSGNRQEGKIARKNSNKDIRIIYRFADYCPKVCAAEFCGWVLFLEFIAKTRISMLPPSGIIKFYSPAEKEMNAYTPYILFIRQIMHIMNNIIFNDLYIIIYYI